MIGKNKVINTNFWKDEKVHKDFTAEDKIFWLFLLTNSTTNNLGCYKFDTYYASNELGYTETVIENILKRFVEYHKILLIDYDTKEILIKNYSKYNWTSSPTYKKGLENEYQNIKSTNLRIQILTIIRDYYGEELITEYDFKKEKETLLEPKRSKIFKKPTVEEIREYCISRNNKIDAEHFYDYNESKGWVVGKVKMKDWKAAVRTWERNNKKENTTQVINTRTPRKNNGSQNFADLYDNL